MTFSGEPKLEDLLSDPIVVAMMRSDGVDRERLGCILRSARRGVRRKAVRAVGATTPAA